METRRQLIIVLTIVFFIIFFGAIGYRLLGDTGMSWIDSFYHTLLTISSIGYTDTGYGTTSAQKIYGVLFMALCLITLSLTGAAFVAFFTESKVHKRVWEVIMAAKMMFKRSHHIIIGVNKVAPHIISEFKRTQTPFCVIAQDESIISELLKVYKDLIIFHYPDKHFTEKIFKQVQLDKAVTVTLDLGNDETNHITADLVREYNPSLKILAVGDEMSYMPVMSKRIQHVVNPHFMCAMRLASLSKRPSVVNYLDRMLYKKDGVYRIEEVEIKENSPLVGKTLGEIDLPHRLQLCVVELMTPTEDGYKSNFLPLPENVVSIEMIICVQGEVNQIEKLRDLADGQKTWTEIESK